ncbi:MAG: RNA polymerase sigma factor SigM [Acidothermus sp.]|nr:RNA polymerase sigma factor SigM [Acidothermus sp.]MCL6537361.1 RNA polymerase sigma factor SigM [Acidothermus sp.]
MKGSSESESSSPAQPLDAATDALLLRRHLAGDPDAFAEIFRRHRDRLWSVALRVLGSPEDAADAVQDAVISALRAAASFRGEAALGTWLHRILVNTCSDYLRRRQRAALGAHDDGRTPSEAAPDTAEAAATAVDVTTALARLDADRRIAVVLVDMVGYPVTEAAALLGIPVGTLKSRCFRARAALARELRLIEAAQPPPDSASQETGNLSADPEVQRSRAPGPSDLEGDRHEEHA